MSLETALDHLLAAKRISGNKQSYKSDNPSEYAKVKAYLDGGARPTGVTTEMGVGLLEVEDAHRAETPGPTGPTGPPDPTGPTGPTGPPPTGQPVPANGIITAGGTYSGTSASRIDVQTTQPVTLSGVVITMTSGNEPLVKAEGEGKQLVLDRCRLTGPDAWDSGRAVSMWKQKALVVKNCDIVNTTGIELSYGDPAGHAIITKNRHRNIKGQESPFIVGNFVQFRVCTHGTIEVSWNEILNEYNKSYASDVISIYHTANTRVFDNYIQHQSLPGNAFNSSSQGTITIDGSDRAGDPCNDNIVERNQSVDAGAIITYVNADGGSNNVLRDNRIVGDIALPNGQQKGNFWGTPLVIIPGGQNNHAHGNYVAYVDRTGVSPLDPFDATYPTHAAHGLRGAAEGWAAEVPKNTWKPKPITKADEDAEWTFWQQKVAAAGVKIGA